MNKEICFGGSQSKIGSRLIELLEVNYKILPIKISKIVAGKNTNANLLILFRFNSLSQLTNAKDLITC